MITADCRRGFLRSLTLAGAGTLLGGRSRCVAAERGPETTRIRLVEITGICIAPQYVADELLRGERFTDVQYVKAAAGVETAKALAGGKADVSLNFVAPLLIEQDAGGPILMIAGIHVGCFVLFGTDRVR